MDQANDQPEEPTAVDRYPTGSGIRATIFNRRIGPQEVIIYKFSSCQIQALATGQPPATGELLKILFQTGQEISGIVSWVDRQAFSIRLDPNLSIRRVRAGRAGAAD